MNVTERCFIIPLQISHGLALVLPDAKGRGDITPHTYGFASFTKGNSE